MKAVLFALTLTCAASTTFAQNITIWGPESGPPTCSHWLSKEAGSVQGQWYRSWLMGTLSGVALGSGQNILDMSGASASFFWMDKYCRDNPLNSSVEGVVALTKELKQRKGLK